VAEARYAQGQNNYLRVTRAHVDALKVNRQLLQRQSEGLLATVRLVEALGGGWDEPAPATDSLASNP